MPFSHLRALPVLANTECGRLHRYLLVFVEMNDVPDKLRLLTFLIIGVLCAFWVFGQLNFWHIDRSSQLVCKWCEKHLFETADGHKSSVRLSFIICSKMMANALNVKRASILIVFFRYELLIISV